MSTATSVLKKYWGFDKFRPAQEEAISKILNADDVITLLPTGGGKSICFQVPALIKDGLGLVISPLISLMQDQVESLQSKGIKAMMIGGTVPFNQLQVLLDNCTYGKYKFLYISPERLQNEYVQERLKAININLIAIDEAHCISEWGHDFRPAYRKIAILRTIKPKVPFIALTATATKRVLKDIQDNLELNDAKVIKQSFERHNLALIVHKTQDKNHVLTRFLKKYRGTSIVYVRNRKLSIQLTKLLKYHQITAAAFHGGMPLQKKESILQDWKAEKFDVIVGTTAFGMGIDKANVRNVVHYQLPDSLESYYQEIGRAGRDGKPSKTLLLYNNADIITLKDQFLKNIPTIEALRLIYKKLNAHLHIAYGEGQEEEFNFNFSKFCHTYNLKPQLTFNTLQLLEQLDVIDLFNEYHQRTELAFRIQPRLLYDYIDNNPSFKLLIHSLLRMQGGFFESKSPVDLYQLQSHSGLSQKKIRSQLEKLHQQEIIDLDIADQDTTIRFLVPREDKYTLNPLLPYLKKYKINKKEKIEAVIKYITNNESCKTIQLLSYFDETKTEDCGHCSFCINKAKSKTASDIKNIKADILNQLSIPLNSKDLADKMDYKVDSILDALRYLLDEQKIKRLDDNRFIKCKE